MLIDEQADHLRGLISDLLDAGRIDAGTRSVSPVPVELATCPTGTGSPRSTSTPGLPRAAVCAGE